MNTTLKSVCGLLKRSELELQAAAVRVLGALRPREPGVHKALGELLVTTRSADVFAAILEAMQANPNEHALKYLLKILEKEDEHQDQVLNAISKIGGKAVSALVSQFERASFETKLKIISILPRIRTPQAHTLLIECFFSPDHEMVRDAVHALREEIHHYQSREAGDLFQRLSSALRDKRTKTNDAALSAVIISHGILADLRSKAKLLPLLKLERGTRIRRHVLMSLAKLEFAGDRHHDVFDAVFPFLHDSDYEGVARHAVQVLMRIKPRRSDNSRIRELLGSKHAGVQVYAVQALSQLDSVTNAEKVLGFLDHPNTQLRDSASRALRNMPSAVNIILRHLDEEPNRVKLFEMVRILESHANRIKVDKARGMVKRMIELCQAGDEHYQIYRTAIRHLRGDILQKELVSRATKARKKSDFEAVRDYLKLLDHTELMTPEIRFMLAIAKLKTSKKNRARTFRLSDYCLEHIAHLLREDPKGFKRRFLAEKALTVDDILYVGFHFSEQLNQERRFGVDLLRHVVKKSPRSKAAQVARQKLKVEGH